MDAPSTLGPVPPGALDEAGFVAQDIECKRCGYNLRGLQPENRCPECGTPVGLSIAGDLLRFSDPNWVATVARGLGIMLWMILVGIILGCMGGLAQSATGASGITLLVQIFVSLLAAYGVWLLSAPEPARIGQDPLVNVRKFVRFAVIVGVLISLGPMLLAVTPPPLHIVWLILAIPAYLVWLAGEYAKFLYYGQLAARIPDRVLWSRARFLRWAFVVSFAIMLLGSAAVAVAPAPPTVAPPPVAAAPAAAPPVTGPSAAQLVGLGLVGVAGMGVLVFGVLTMFLIMRLRKAILAQAALARQSWAAALAPA